VGVIDSKGTGERIVVTGGAGYIGSHTCKALAREGFVPVTVDNLSRGHRWAVKWGPLEVADIRDGAALARVFEVYRPKAVVHFAAFAFVAESVENPYLYFDNNVAGTLSLLSAMQGAGVDRLVFSSSCAVYGNAETVPIAETHPTVPVNPYGLSKLIAETMIREFVRDFGFRAVALRYFNAAGADPEGETGELHDPEPHVVPSFLNALAAGAEAQINGDDWPTSDGTCIRDYIHVHDLAQAHVKALRYLEGNGGFEAVNLGTGRGWSLREVAAAVDRATGRKLRVRIGPRRPGDPAALVGDATRARTLLGWAPQYPDLGDGIAHAWRWLCRDAEKSREPAESETGRGTAPVRAAE
jgi:UDP-arabinose 4-epimerase